MDKKIAKSACKLYSAIRKRQKSTNQNFHIQIQDLAKNMDRLMREYVYAVQRANEPDKSYYSSAISGMAERVTNQIERYKQDLITKRKITQKSKKNSDLWKIYNELVFLQRQQKKSIVCEHNPGDKSKITYNKDLMFNIGNITLEGIDLHDFRITLSYKNIENDLILSAESTDPVFSKDSHYFHPHVSTSHLVCLGDGVDITWLSLESFEIANLIDIATSILNTYNSASPYLDLKYWRDDYDDTDMCSDCGASPESSDMYACKECGDQICEDCVRYCDGCSEQFCSSCMSTCSECGESFCSNCLYACSECYKESSYVQVCEECRIPCSYCQRTLCDDHANKCDICGRYFCNDCLFNCDKGYTICEQCNITLSQCTKCRQLPKEITLCRPVPVADIPY